MEGDAGGSGGVSGGSLAYIDAELDVIPGLRERVDAMVLEEMRAMAREGITADVAGAGEVPEEMPERFRGSEILGKEWTRMLVKQRAQGQAGGEAKDENGARPVEEEGKEAEEAGLDTRRFGALPPEDQKREDPMAWRDAVCNARAQAEHQKTRTVNLELLMTYGPQSWQAFSEDVQGAADRMQATREQTEREVEAINAKRKLAQDEALPRLHKLEVQRRQLIDKTARLRAAVRAQSPVKNHGPRSLLGRDPEAGKGEEGKEASDNDGDKNENDDGDDVGRDAAPAPRKRARTRAASTSDDKDDEEDDGS